MRKKWPNNLARITKVRIFALAKPPQGSEATIRNAEIAQLVEHNLAKVGVASSSLVFRSQNRSTVVPFVRKGYFERNILLYIQITNWRGGGIGRRATLRG